MVWNTIINGKSQTVPLRFFVEGRGGLYTGYSNHASTYFHIGTPSSADELSFNLFADDSHIRFPGSRIGDRGSWIVD